MSAVFRIGIGNLLFVKRLRQGKRQWPPGKFYLLHPGNFIRHAALPEDAFHLFLLAGKHLKDRCSLDRVDAAAVQDLPKERFRHRVQRERTETVLPLARGQGIPMQKCPQQPRRRFPVNLHQRLRSPQQLLCLAAVIGQALPVVAQVVFPVGVKTLHAFPYERRRPRDIVQMPIDAVLHAAQVIRRDLSRHIDRDPAFQPQHHLLKRPIDVVNDVQMQPLFEHGRDTKHPFLAEVHILRHVRHRHVAAHKHWPGAPREHRRLQKVQLALLHLLQSIVIAVGRKAERRDGRADLVKVDCLDVFLQIKGIQSRQKLLHRVGILLARRIDPFRKQRGQRLSLGFCVTEQVPQDFRLAVPLANPHQELAGSLHKVLDIHRAALPREDARQIGGVKIQRPRQLGDAHLQYGKRALQVCVHMARPARLFIDCRLQPGGHFLPGKAGNTRRLRQLGDPLSQLRQLRTVTGRFSIPRPIAADHRVGQPGCRRKLLCGTGKPVNILL